MCAGTHAGTALCYARTWARSHVGAVARATGVQAHLGTVLAWPKFGIGRGKGGRSWGRGMRDSGPWQTPVLGLLMGYLNRTGTEFAHLVSAVRDR
jgi:hypothetical protein